MGFDIKDRDPNRLVSIPQTTGDNASGFDPVNDARELIDAGADDLVNILLQSDMNPVTPAYNAKSAMKFGEYESVWSDVLAEIDDGFVRVAPSFENWSKFIKPDKNEFLYNPASNHWEEVVYETDKETGEKGPKISFGSDGGASGIVTNPKKGFSGVTPDNLVLHTDGPKILWQVQGSQGAKLLDKELVGENAYQALAQQINSAKSEAFKTYYDISMPGFYSAVSDIEKQPDDVVTLKIGLGSGELLRSVDGSTLKEAMMAIAVFGFVKHATSINFATGEITFANAVEGKSPKDLALDALNQICGRKKLDGTRRSFYDPIGKSLAYFHMESSRGQAVVDPSWMWLLTDSITGYKNDGVKAEVGGIEFGDLNDEIKLMQKNSVSQSQYLYYVLAADDSGMPAYTLLSTQGEGNKIIPFRSLTAFDDIVSQFIPASNEQEVVFLSKPINQNDLRLAIPGMKEQSYKISPSSDYFFTYTTSAGTQYRVVRVPVSNRLATEANDYQEFGYMTHESLSFFSSVFDIGSTEGMISPMIIDGDKPVETFNVNGNMEQAFYYKSNIQTLTISKNITDLARTLQKDFDADFGLTDEMQAEEVFDAVLAYFEENANDRSYLPKGDFSDPDAWVDERGEVNFAGEQLPYRLAMYVLALSVRFSSKSEKIGESMLDFQTETRNKAEYLQYGNVVFMAVMAVFQIVAGFRAQKKLYKEAMATQMVDSDQARELAKKMKDPNWSPDFMSPMFDPNELQDPNPYFTTAEREIQIRQVMESLTGGAFSAAFILGEAGVGKTEMMREIQRRFLLPQQEAINAGVPRPLLGKIIYEVDANKWDARNGMVGADSKTMAEFILFMKRKTSAVAFFDEAKMLTSSGLHGGSQGQDLQGNTPFEKMLPYLSDRKLFAVFATTKPEYEQFFKNNVRFGAFLRRLEKIELSSYDVNEVKVALAEIYPVLLEKYKVIAIDTNEPMVPIRVKLASGMESVIHVPKVINDIVDAVSRERYVIDNPNVLMDFTIKRIKILAEKVIRDVSEYNSNPNRGRGVLNHPVDHELGTLLERRVDLKFQREQIKSEIETAKVKSDSFFVELYDYIHATPGFIQKLPERWRKIVPATILAGMSTAGVYYGWPGEDGLGVINTTSLTLGGYAGLRSMNVLFGESFRKWVETTPFKAKFNKLFENLKHWEKELSRIDDELKNVEAQLFEKGGDKSLIKTYEFRKDTTQAEIDLIEAKLNSANLHDDVRKIKEAEYKAKYGPGGEVTRKRTELDAVQAKMAENRKLRAELAVQLDQGADPALEARIATLNQEFKQLSESYHNKSQMLANSKIEEETLKYQTGELRLNDIERKALVQRRKRLNEKVAEYETIIDKLKKQNSTSGIQLSSATWAAYREEILKESEEELKAQQAENPIPPVATSASSEVEEEPEIESDESKLPNKTVTNETVTAVQKSYSGFLGGVSLVGNDLKTLNDALNVEMVNRLRNGKIPETPENAAKIRFIREYASISKALNGETISAEILGLRDTFISSFAMHRIAEFIDREIPSNSKDLAKKILLEMGVSENSAGARTLMSLGRQLDEKLPMQASPVASGGLAVPAGVAPKPAVPNPLTATQNFVSPAATLPAPPPAALQEVEDDPTQEVTETLTDPGTRSPGNTPKIGD